MPEPMVARRRWTECRRTYTPAVTARSCQRVCSPECRHDRDRKLARSRRRRDLDEHRAADRERQKEWRAGRAASGCHAPPSGRKRSEWPREIIETVDRLFQQSRATLLRRLLGIFQGPKGPSVAKAGAVSHASFATQEPESTSDPAQNLAARHA
jgi:hypothetical protein